MDSSEPRNIGNTYPPPNKGMPRTANVIRCPSGNWASRTASFFSAMPLIDRHQESVCTAWPSSASDGRR